MATTPLHIELKSENAEFLRECVECGEAADTAEMLDALVQQERDRRQTALEDRLEAALTSGRIEITWEELASDNAWEILSTRKPVPSAELEA